MEYVAGTTDDSDSPIQPGDLILSVNGLSLETNEVIPKHNIEYRILMSQGQSEK